MLLVSTLYFESRVLVSLCVLCRSVFAYTLSLLGSFFFILFVFDCLWRRQRENLIKSKKTIVVFVQVFGVRKIKHKAKKQSNLTRVY